uniref:Retrotransposon gag domain-containing protein n=1 Tax=Tanacetum cinerariifolium TaxID=118510 RepID=A0A6L2KHB4_TANCI|nr:hypothetical protein [Tanacetum cinerariifolium]
MVVSTRNSNPSTFNGTPLSLDDETKRFLAETIVGMMKKSLPDIQISMANMANDITTFSLQNNQVLNSGPQLNLGRMAKIEFLKFSGDDVKGWVFRCEQFFMLEQTPELDKVNLVFIHLYDKALLWHSQFIRPHGTIVTWEVYKETILARFGNVYEDPMSELKNLKYETTAREYEDAFDSLLSRVEISEDHVISFFMGGLPTEIEMRVRMFKPKTLAGAYCLTNLQEATLNAVKKKGRSAFVPNQSRDFLEIDESVVNHGLMDLQEPLIFLIALTGTNNFKTMRVIGTIGKHLLHILIDCGSTHNFLDRNMAKQLGCNIKATCPLSVTVADGNKLITTSECKQFKWQFGPHPFSIDVMLLPLGGCDMVLEIQWLATFGNIRFNFQELRKDFKHNNKRVLLREVPSAPISPILQQVIVEYEDVFAIPTELPPKKDHENTVPLIEGTQPVNIRPYRHHPSKKDAIEGVVAELQVVNVILVNYERNTSTQQDDERGEAHQN